MSIESISIKMLSMIYIALQKRIVNHIIFKALNNSSTFCGYMNFKKDEPFFIVLFIWLLILLYRLLYFKKERTFENISFQ